MLSVVIGSAAGGGFPHWNCNTDLCRGARCGETSTQTRTQSSIAVSANGEALILNPAQDLRQQINTNKALHPTKALHDSPNRAVVLTSGDLASSYAKQHAKTCEQQMNVLKILKFKCDVLCSQLDGLYLTYVEPRLIPSGCFIPAEDTLSKAAPETVKL